MELLDQEADLTKEQAALDEHDDQVPDLSDCVEQLRLLVSDPSIEQTPTTSHAGELAKRLKYMEDKLASVMEEVRPLVLGPTLDSCFIVHQLNKRVDMALNELMGISREILALDKGGEDLLVQALTVEKAALNLSLRIERVSYHPGEISPKPTASSGVKLPKIDVPTFKG